MQGTPEIDKVARRREQVRLAMRRQRAKQTQKQKEQAKKARTVHMRNYRATHRPSQAARTSERIRKAKWWKAKTLNEQALVNEARRFRYHKEDRDVTATNERLAKEAKDSYDLKPYIEYAVKHAKKKLHRTQTGPNSSTHRAHVCICCDCFLRPSEDINTLSEKQLKNHRHRLGVHEYEEYHDVKLHKDLIQQYHVDPFKNMLLSKRSRKLEDGWVACSQCHGSLQPRNSKTTKPPKFAIANGFAIGEFPKTIKRHRQDPDDTLNRSVHIDDISDEMRVLVAPIRPYGYMFAYTGGSHKSVHGQFCYYETDQPSIGGVMNDLDSKGAPSSMYIMLCGKTTPEQRKIIRRRAEFDRNEYLDILNYFITESGHPGYKDMPLPQDFPKPNYIEDEATGDNTAHSMNSKVEDQYLGGTYYLSTAQDPSYKTSVFEDAKKFARAYFGDETPTLLTTGGNYANMKDLKVEDVLPFAFPFGLGGPGGPRRTPISPEACFQRYFRLSMRQFMRGDTILILGHMYNRILSYRSALLTSRNMINGLPIGERLAEFKASDFRGEGNEATDTLLKAVETSCRALGHTPEAAKHARQKYWAMNDHFGLNSVYATVTPDDLCSFRVRLYANAEESVSFNFFSLNTNISTTCKKIELTTSTMYPYQSQHELPDLNMSEDDCLLEIKLRKETRLKYPGACALEYEHVMSVFLEDLLQWDPKKQCAKRPGVLGTVLAFGPADEEQGRGTLHSHWQIWIKELTQELRDLLFATNQVERASARAKFFRLVDQMIHTTYGPDLKVEHICTPVVDSNGDIPKVAIPASDVFKDRDEQIFRDARNRTMNKGIRGQVMHCPNCKVIVSTQDVVNLSLEHWLEDAQHKGTKFTEGLPLTPERLDIAALRHSYDTKDGCVKLDDHFWANKDVRDVLLRFKFDEHDWKHRSSCFKKGCDCRFFLPEPSHGQTDIYSENELKGELEDWHTLDGNDPLRIPTWVLQTLRTQGCQYINAHNRNISEVLNCNTNVQIGDISQVYYSTLYCGKSSQKEDSERRNAINQACSKRLLRVQNEVDTGIRSQEEVQDGFVEGLCRMLSAVHAAYSRLVISATMQHRLVSTGGSRFQFSHGFGFLLIPQMEATLMNEPVNVRIRKNILKGEEVFWADSPSDDYLYRPNDPQFEDMCPYEFAMHYRKSFKSFKDMKDIISPSAIIDNDDNDIDEDEQEYVDGISEHDRFQGQRFKKKWRFNNSHPGFHFSQLCELKKMVIPKVYLPKGKLCNIEEIKLQQCQSAVDDDVKNLRENYAKMALMMFYPYRTPCDLLKNGSHWELFDDERTRYFDNKRQALEIQLENRDNNLQRPELPKGKFWKKGFDILQNMQNRNTMEKKLSKRARDKVTVDTVCQAPDLNPGSSNSENPENEHDNVVDILKFCNEHRGYEHSIFDVTFLQIVKISHLTFAHSKFIENTIAMIPMTLVRTSKNSIPARNEVSTTSFEAHLSVNNISLMRVFRLRGHCLQ